MAKTAKTKSGGDGGNGAAVADPVLAKLLKQQAEQLEKTKAKIRARQQQLNSQSRKARNRVLMLTGIAYHADAEIHPEKRAEIIATLNRAITEEKPREFLKSQGWL